MDKVKKLWCYRRFYKNYTSLCVFPNLRYFSNYFEHIYRAQGSSMSWTAITQKFKMSLLFEKWKTHKQTNKQTNKQQQWQRLKKTETFVVWHNDLDSFYVLKVRERVISYYSIPRSAIERRIAWAHRFDWISYDSKYRTLISSIAI